MPPFTWLSKSQLDSENGFLPSKTLGWMIFKGLSHSKVCVPEWLSITCLGRKVVLCIGG